MWGPIAFLTLLGSVGAAERIAIVYLSDPTGNFNVTGNVTFMETENGISVVGTVIGLAPGNHGFHVHNYGKVFSDCLASGPHFNPENYTHGAPNDTIRHVGDLGNVIALDDGIATINMVDTVIALQGVHNIIGRALVVHEGEDDLGRGGNETSLTTGNAGGRVACGVIGILDDGSSSSTTIVSANVLVNVLVLFAIYGLRYISPL